MSETSESLESNLVLLRDTGKIDPPTVVGGNKATQNAYSFVSEPKFVQCGDKDIWDPQGTAQSADGEHKVLSRLDKAYEQRRRLVKLTREKILVALDHQLTLLLFTIMTLWALFCEEMRVAADFSKSTDIPFASISFAFMNLFFIEWALRSWASPDEYFLSFFFWLDLIATTSMVFDVLPIFVGVCGAISSLSLSNLRSTTRIGRILRLLRVVRVVKLIAVFRQQQENESERTKPSAVGKRLNEKIVQNVIISVLYIMVLLPFLSITEDNQSSTHGLALLTRGNALPTVSEATFGSMLDDYRYRMQTFTKSDFYEISLLYVSIPNSTSGGDSDVKLLTFDGVDYVSTDSDADNGTSAGAYASCFEGDGDILYGCPEAMQSGLRCSQLIVTDVDFECASGVKWNGDSSVGDRCVARAVWDNHVKAQQDATTSLVMTLFIGILLFLSFVMYSQDVTSLVVRPIEAMINVVHKLAENPTLSFKNETKSRYEVEAVRVALAKIVGLMQLGFGGAGHEIIAANLANAEGQELDLMRMGKKMDCAYGFCDIRQFTDTVECLQDQVMLFTNSVGEIVHQACHDNRGEPNKNIGDAFLIVWRSPKGPQDYRKVVDGALTAFRRCVREIASSQTLQLVTNVEAIHKKFGRNKYRTKLGFGLHFGWSVEGPVGSPTKIDCSYLSPEVKISDRLEAATKVYSCNILMSGQFYDLLSDHMKVGIRLIDHITLKGGHKPFRVYADDRSNLWLKIHPRLVEIYGAEAAYEQFSKTFHEGIDNFIKGDWPTAAHKLEGALDFCPKDVPTKLLLKAMRAHSADGVTLTAPVNWKGFHESEV